MFKTVSFNIFEEHLQDIVYGKNSRVREKEQSSTNTKQRFTVQTITELIVQPINPQNLATRNFNKQNKK